MADIHTEVVAFPVHGGECAGYLARPTQGTPASGIVVVQEWWGLNEHIKDVTRRFAAEGYVALAPDLYRGTVTDNANMAANLMDSLNVPNAVRDILGAVRYLGRIGAAKIGIVGFCLGGKLTIEAGIEGGDAISAIVPFYGYLPTPMSRAAKITAPVLALYGGKDPGISADDVDEFEAELKRAGREVETRTYRNADHAFFNDTRPGVYDEKASADAWRRTLDFLKRHVG